MKTCKIHNVPFISLPNSTIQFCPKCRIEKNRNLLIAAINGKKKPNNELLYQGMPNGIKKADKWKYKALLALIKHVQEKMCNPYIRWRDKTNFGKCISSRGDVKHAGHYYPRGTHNGMRFHIMNIHGQSISSNMHKSGDLINYRKGLISRHGQAYMDKLEHEEAKYKQYGFKFDRFNVVCIGLTYKYLLENEISVFDIDVFNKYFDEIYKKESKNIK